MDASVAQALVETLTGLDEEITAARATVDRLMLERQGVEAALKRFGHTSTTIPASPAPAADEGALPSDVRPKEQADNSVITSRVLDLLHNAGGPLRIGEIAEGVGLDITQARSAVAYLKRKSEVRNPERGLWQAVAPTDTETAPVSTEAVSAPIHQQMKGGGASGTDLDGDHGEFSSGQAEHCDHRHGASVVEALR